MTGSPAFDVTVNEGPFDQVDVPTLVRAVEETLLHEGAAEAEVSVTLLDDEGIRELNLRYLQRDRPTDVIAFSLGQTPSVLGDVYIGLEQARRQASELGVPLGEELVRLTVHGVLHVLGHDHPEDGDREASPMFAVQETLVRRILG